MFSPSLALFVRDISCASIVIKNNNIGSNFQCFGSDAIFDFTFVETYVAEFREKLASPVAPGSLLFS